VVLVRTAERRGEGRRRDSIDRIEEQTYSYLKDGLIGLLSTY
jgi:hypothetical protein